jgi:hypothetical protein
MNPFYDLNKRLTGIGAEPKTPLVETRTVAAKSPATRTFEEALRTDLRSLMEDKSLSQAATTVKKGALHKQEGIPKDKKIGDKKLNSLKKSGTPLEKKRANFALNIQGKGKKKVDENMSSEEWSNHNMYQTLIRDALNDGVGNGSQTDYMYAIAKELGKPITPAFEKAFHETFNSFFHIHPDDYDDDANYTDHSMRQGEMGLLGNDTAKGHSNWHNSQHGGDLDSDEYDSYDGGDDDEDDEDSGSHYNDYDFGREDRRGLDEADRGFRGVGGARDREDDEHHHLDQNNSNEKRKFYKLLDDGKLYVKSVSPGNINAAYGDGWLPSKSLALAKGGQQGMAENKDDADDPVAAFLAKGGKIQQGEPTHKHTPRRKSSNSGDYTDFSMRRGERGIHGRGYGYDPEDHQSRNDELDYPTKDIRKPEYEGYEGCAECAMGECDMHGEQPKDMNPRNKDWDDAGVARLRAQKNQRTAKRRVGQRDTGQPPAMTDLDETHSYNELKDIYMWTERHGMPSWKLVARNVLGQSVGHAIDRLCGKHFDTDPDDYEVVASGSKPKSLSESMKKSGVGKKKCPPMSHIKKMCQDGKSFLEICKMHPDCDRTELKQMVADCKKKTAPLAESEEDILSYLKNKIAPANTKSRATSRPYNGRPGAADAHNGMEFEESAMKPDSIHWRDLQNYTGAVNIFTKSGRPVSYGRAVDGMYHGIPLTTFVIKDNLVVKKAMDNNTGDAMEEGMFPGSDEYDSKFGKPTADLDSAFSRGSSPAGGTVYTRKRKEVPFDSDEVEKPVASSDGPRKRGRPAGSKGGGGARLAGTHVPKHARSKEMDEDLDECPNCGQSMPGHGRGREIDLEAVKQGMGHFVNNVAPAARKAAGIAKVVGGAKSTVDYDGDGKKESGKAEHAGSVDKAIKANNSKSSAKPAAPAKGSNKPAAPAKSSDKTAKKAKEGDKPAKKTEEGKGDGNLANNAKPYGKVTRGDVVAGRLGKDEEGGKKKDKKEKKVEETTTGSVATSSGGKSSGGMSVGKGIYDSWNRKYNTMLSESINITTNSTKGDEGEEDEHITIDVSGDDVARIKELLHSMGVGGDDGAEHMHGSQGMPLDFIEIDEAVGEEETPKPSAPVPPGPNGPWQAGSPQAQAYSKMSPADQKFLGHANPLDPLILARAPNGGKPVAASAQARASADAADGVNQGPRGQTAAPVAAAKPAAPAAAGGLLAVGSKGPEVVALQKLLGITPADGDFGPATKAAVMKKQGELKVAVDGVWGPESKAAMSAQAGRVNGQNVSPEHQTAPAPTPPAAKSQADKIARFKELLAQARKRPDSISAATASDPNYNPGTYPGNPSTPPAPAASAAPFNAATPQGFDESISHFLNKMRLLEDLSAEEKKEIEALYKELGNTEQPDPELSSLLNQYSGLFPTGSTASSGADQAGASADAADADAGAAMQSGANRAAREKEYGDNADADDAAQGAAIRDAAQAAATANAADGPDTSGAGGSAGAGADAANMAAATADAADGPSTGGPGMPLQPIPGQTGVAAIPPNADKTKPFWVKGTRFEWKYGSGGTMAWRQTASPTDKFQLNATRDKTSSGFSGAQLDELAQRNSENQRLRELAGIAEAVAPVTKNAPDYPTNQVTADTKMMTQNLSGGLNGAKSTGQTTTPVVASQVKRLHSHVSEGQRMIDLYKTISAIENKEG